MNINSLQRICTLLMIGLLLLCISPPVAFPGWYFLATTTSAQASSSANRPAQLVNVISQNRMKYTTNVWTLMVHLGTQRLVLVNHIRKRYWEGPVDEYFSLQAQQLKESQQKAEQMLQVMPLEQSQRLRAFSRVDPFDPLLTNLIISTTQIAEQTTIAGRQAQKYEVRRNGEPYEETWLATSINIAGEIDEQKRKEFVRKLQLARTTPPGAVLAELTDLVSEGYPLKTINVVSRVTKEVVQVQQREFSDEEFTAPTGHTQSSLTETMTLR